MTKTINVLIVEDEPIIALEISYVLRKEGYRIVGPAHTATRAIDLLAGGQVDFAILDINLGRGQSGIEIAALIQSKYKIPYIFLTAFSDAHTLAAAQEQSPFGYLVKPFQPATLLSTSAIAISNFKRLQKGMDFSNLPVSLTQQEQNLCEHLIQGKSYQQVADEMIISINTVRYHIKNLYLKLDVNSRAALIGKLIGA
jgi:DNA-binding NarL/FixJ family response regulator